MPGLEKMARDKMAGPPVFLLAAHAEAILKQFMETAQYRGWELHAAAIMRNHIHIVVGVPGDPEPDIILRDLKSYGSRRLNRLFERPKSGTWWTASGSRRKLPHEHAVQAAVEYVRHQEYPLLIWIAPMWDGTHEK
jgi:REP element-mobilizing transposase RayT